MSSCVCSPSADLKNSAASSKLVEGLGQAHVVDAQVEVVLLAGLARGPVVVDRPALGVFDQAAEEDRGAVRSLDRGVGGVLRASAGRGHRRVQIGTTLECPDRVGVPTASAAMCGPTWPPRPTGDVLSRIFAWPCSHSSIGFSRLLPVCRKPSAVSVAAVNGCCSSTPSSTNSRPVTRGAGGALSSEPGGIVPRWATASSTYSRDRRASRALRSASARRKTVLKISSDSGPVYPATRQFSRKPATSHAP